MSIYLFHLLSSSFCPKKYDFMSRTLLRQWVASCPRTLGKYAYPTCESCQNHILDIAFLQENNSTPNLHWISCQSKSPALYFLFYETCKFFCISVDIIFHVRAQYHTILHVLHRQALVHDIEFLEFSCCLEEMLGFIF